MAYIKELLSLSLVQLVTYYMLYLFIRRWKERLETAYMSEEIYWSNIFYTRLSLLDCRWIIIEWCNALRIPCYLMSCNKPID